MRRAIPSLLFLAFVLACQGDGPTEPTEEFEAFNLAAKLRGPPDLSGLLPELERRVFIHYRSGFGKPEGRGKKPPKEETSQCFSFMANGAGWNVVEPYVTTFALPTDTWDAVAGPVPISSATEQSSGRFPCSRATSMKSTVRSSAHTPMQSTPIQTSSPSRWSGVSSLAHHASAVSSNGIY